MLRVRVGVLAIIVVDGSNLVIFGSRQCALHRCFLLRMLDLVGGMDHGLTKPLSSFHGDTSMCSKSAIRYADHDT